MMPTGFRFNPTDEELIQILDEKASGRSQMSLQFIVERNVYDHEPQHLRYVGDYVRVLKENERYYYYKKKNDSREVSKLGWWKATSHVKKIYANGQVVGTKRPMTFHKFVDNSKNRTNGIKTSWIMHEYSLESNTTEWRLCKIKYKGIMKSNIQEQVEMEEKIRKSPSFQNADNNYPETSNSTRNVSEDSAYEQVDIYAYKSYNYFDNNESFEWMNNIVENQYQSTPQQILYYNDISTDCILNDYPYQPIFNLWHWEN